MIISEYLQSRVLQQSPLCHAFFVLYLALTTFRKSNYAQVSSSNVFCNTKSIKKGKNLLLLERFNNLANVACFREALTRHPIKVVARKHRQDVKLNLARKSAYLYGDCSLPRIVELCF